MCSLTSHYKHVEREQLHPVSVVGVCTKDCRTDIHLIPNCYNSSITVTNTAQFVLIHSTKNALLLSYCMHAKRFT